MTDDEAISVAIAALLAREGDVSLDAVEKELSRVILRPVTEVEVERVLVGLERAGRQVGATDEPLGRDALVAVGRAAVALRRELNRTPAIEEIARRAGVSRADAMRGLILMRFAARTPA